jgi:hypothetical protein
MTTNSMNIKIDPNKITQMLNISALQLDASTLFALRDVRQNALKKQRARSPAFTLATTHGGFYKLIPHSFQQWAIGGLLAVMLVIGTSYWNHAQVEQTAELDVAILTDDLPIEVFAD